MHIVLVEDNEVLARSLVRIFSQEGHTTTHFLDSELAKTWILHNHTSIDIIILDVLLPGIDGFEVCRSVRASDITTPILMLTSKDTIDDVVTGLDYGADDYLKKPFATNELLARLRTLLRRQPITHTDAIIRTIPGITIDTVSQLVTTSQGTQIPLTTKEFSILCYFSNHPGEIINQQRLYDHLFDFAEVQLSNTIEVHIKNIRKKCKAAHYEIPLTTIRGAGYRLDL